MALSALFNGSDCGPVNPLSSLAKQFDTDRGVQQDLFGPGRANSSQQPFRTQSAENQALQDAARFFAEQRAVQLPLYPTSFDPLNLNALNINLPKVDQSFKPLAKPSFAMTSSWSGEFMKQENKYIQAVDVGLKSKALLPQSSTVPFFSPLGIRQTFPTPNMRFEESMREQSFSLKEANFEQAEAAANAVTTPVTTPPMDSDELSKTAGLLIDAVKQESNPKFKNSAFLSLMRQLRDREMTIQGSDIVQINPNEINQYSLDVKGKGKGKLMEAFEGSSGSLVVDDRYEIPGIRLNSIDPSSSSSALSLDQMSSAGEHYTSISMESDEDRFWKEENDAYKQYWSHSISQSGSYRHPEWDKLQEDWDKFEANSAGIATVSNYPFQTDNPYIRGPFAAEFARSGRWKEKSYESLLELEAAVQLNSGNSDWWFRLGVKQQENERERHAILALERATVLDPSYLEAWLALAISYTNEGDKSGAFNATRSWLYNNPKYKDAVSLSSASPFNGQKDEELTQQLMLLIRQTSDNEIDADLQTALGVVLNTSEGFEKAQDCFRTALSVRPNDWLLYNRVGATLANSGRATDALWYYYQALTLNPSYIRARFNLGIAYINMKQYGEAAQHILDALILQENDTSTAETRGITSSALWECLRNTCSQLQRTDLTVLCDERNLEGFRQAFSN